MRVLSLGAGVQSSTLLLMGCGGEVQIDAAIFADTGWEPRAVYVHLEWLERQATAAGIPVYRVTKGDLRADALVGKSEAWMPLYAAGNGREVQLKRQCTRHYKLRPIHRQARALGATRRQPITLLIGISLDEFARMRDPRVQYLRHEWPLIDRRMTRQDCLHWLERHGYPRPPKSSCVGCPYRDARAWRQMRDTQPEEWADAVAFDAAIRAQRQGDAVYLHRSLRPLPLVNLTTPQERGQMDLFGAECEGLCGV